MSSDQMTPRETFWERQDQVAEFAERAADLRLAAILAGEADPARLRALDLGCAAGRNIELLLTRGCDALALDGSQAMVAFTRQRLAPLIGEGEAQARVLLGRMDDLGRFPDAAFDLIVAFGVYHQAQTRSEWERALAESVRVLAPEGRLLVTVRTPATDLEARGFRPVPGESGLYEHATRGRAYLVSSHELDAHLAKLGLEPLVPTECVTVASDQGRRVTARALYARAART